jgi:putative membrane protein
MLLGAFLALLPRVAAAHTGAPPTPDSVWSSWNFDPLLLCALLLSAWAYSVGVRVVWTRAGVGHGFAIWQVGAYAAGLLALSLALISPLDGMSAALFSAHMVQHLLLILVAAPLLVLGRTLLVLMWALPLSWRRALGRFAHRAAPRAGWRLLSAPSAAWLLAAVTLWLWHVPALYQAALRNNGVHAFEHLCLLATALLFWQTIIGAGARRRCGRAAATGYLLTMAAQCSVLGVLLAFSRPWYPAYAATSSSWRVSPGDDQQIAGLIMWIPAGAIYLGAVAGVLASGLLSEERATARTQAPGTRPARKPERLAGDLHEVR